MTKKVLIISTSPRKNGNSDVLAQYFEKGALERGHDVQMITLRNQNISFCRGCLVCQKKNSCVIKDDASQIVEAIGKSDVIVFSTPVYFYQMCGQMKTLLDRTNPLYVEDYDMRDIYLLLSCADEDEDSVNPVVLGLQGWIDCFEHVELKGVLKGLGLDQYGDIHQHSEYLEQAYLYGRNL